MKATALFVVVFGFLVLIIPMMSIGFNDSIPQGEPVAQSEVQVHTPATQQTVQSTPEATKTQPAITIPQEKIISATSTAAGVASFKILDENTGLVSEITLRDFVRGAVAAEMPVSFHSEALKAQAVAAHTFALHNHLVQLENPDPALKGADFSADPSNMKVYITEATAKSFYGQYADVYWDKICDAADSVSAYVMEYEDEPIVAAYHAISAGSTEDAANVWSGSAPYLASADSPGDLLAPDYKTQLTLSAEQVKAKLQAQYPNMNFLAPAEQWFSAVERSNAGYVTYMDVGGVQLHGKDIRSIFDLRSHNIDVSYDGANFTFEVVGYGHGVGLSQYGADFYARQGLTFDQILETYYTGITLKQISI